MTDLLVRRCPGMIDAIVDGELVGIHIDNGTCYGFNATATRIWSLLEKPMTLSALCAALVAEFAIDMERCAVQVRAVLEELRLDGLVTIEAVPVDRGHA